MPVNLFLEPGSEFPWSFRLVQTAVAVGAGSFVAWRLRTSLSALWAVPLAIVLGRLTLEPNLNAWYSIPVGMLGLIAAADLATGRLQALRARRPQPA